HLTEPYWLGQYPVTNAQFQMFVDDGGYEIAEFWPEAAQEQPLIDGPFWRNGQVWAGNTWRRTPYDFGPKFALPNHPVVGVSWYEALAFCRWLTRRWREQGLLPKHLAVSLPTEAEWEKGARGGETIPQTPLIIPAGQLTKATLPALLDNELPHRRYPWRSETSPEELTNIKETEIGVTSRPSIFADGISPYGCADMMGNVWEWTRTIWGKTDWEKTRGSARWHVELEYRYPYLADERERLDADLLWTRVVRGSSWFNETRSARCASRFTNFPYDVYFSLGFRIVVSPLSSGP
ncbi:MAG: formylglycine-generating enzyme family protein, partial [Anaerolineales bacterium]|nr:formylglycine-generating enzyme family protein [Anaerolineales bacterium]